MPSRAQDWALVRWEVGRDLGLTSNGFTKVPAVPLVPAPPMLGREYSERNPHCQTIADISYADLNTSSTLDATRASPFTSMGGIPASQELMVLLAVEVSWPLACPAGVSRKME